LATLLALVLGVLVWTFWPASAQSLYTDGAKLMESSRLVDWDRAFREYFEPLDARYPDHPYRDAIDQYRRLVEAARNPATSEAKRFYQKGERLRQEGNVKEAQQVWRDLITVFADTGADKDWVNKAQEALHDLDTKEGAKERWAAVKPALDKAAALASAGRREEAEQIWSALEELYRADPFAADILAQVAQARKQ
jgi:tetratricopeptide (TPR) repeat protein